MDTYYDLGLSSKSLFRRLANVLLHGMQNLDKETKPNEKCMSLSDIN